MATAEHTPSSGTTRTYRRHTNLNPTGTTRDTQYMSSSTTKVITPIGILSYPHLDKPQLDKSDASKPAKYSATIVFLSGTDLTQLKQAAVAAAIEKFGATWKLPNGQVISIEQAMVEGVIKSPFRKDALAKGYPEGAVFINTRTQQQPTVVYSHAGPDGKKPAVMPVDKIKAEMYAGAKVKASVVAFGYDTSGNKGVSFALNNLQKVSDGDRLDGRVAAENEFEADLASAPADLASLL